jgi:hypothetical protein
VDVDVDLDVAVDLDVDAIVDDPAGPHVYAP